MRVLGTADRRDLSGEDGGVGAGLHQASHCLQPIHLSVLEMRRVQNSTVTAALGCGEQARPICRWPRGLKRAQRRPPRPAIASCSPRPAVPRHQLDSQVKRVVSPHMLLLSVEGPCQRPVSSVPLPPGEGTGVPWHQEAQVLRP